MDPYKMNQKLCFVEFKDRVTNKISDLLKTSYNLAKDYGMNPVWMSIEQAITLSKKKQENIFIIETTKNKLWYELLDNEFSLIYGPMCIYYCSPKKGLFLPIKKYPTFNLCMHNLDVCIANSDKITLLIGLINFMGGKVSTSFRQTTTHIISNNHVSEYSVLARKKGIPIMNTDWVTTCWDKSLKDVFCANDNSMNKFKLPIFSNFLITSSQIEDKNEIRLLVEKNGGIHSGDLALDKTTHLILGEAIGDKYKYAKDVKSIKIVNINWIFDSVEAGYPLLEENYLFDKENISVISHNLFEAVASLSINLPKSLNYKNSSTIENSIQKSISLDKALSQINKSKVSTLIDKSSQNCVFSKLLSSSSVTTNNNKRKNISIEDELEMLLEKNLVRSSNIFDGFDYYIVGCSQLVVKNLLKKCISLQSGCVSSELRTTVTHILFFDTISELEKQKIDLHINTSDHNIVKVELDWFMNCLRNNKLMPIITIIPDSQTNSNNFFNNEELLLSLEANKTFQYRNQKSKKVGLKLSRHNSLNTQPLKIKETVLEDNNLDDYFNSPKILSQNVQLELKKKLLNDCVITFSSYSEKEKTELTQLAIELGAKCQDILSRSEKPKKGYLCNTHLICNNSKSIKYEKAVEWGLKICTKEWLFKCKEEFKKLDENDYMSIDSIINPNKTSTFNSNTDNNNITDTSSIEQDNYYKNNFNTKSNKLTCDNEQFLDLDVNNKSGLSKSQDLRNKMDTVRSLLANNVETILPLSNFLPTTNSSAKINILDNCRKNDTVLHSIPIAWNDHTVSKTNIQFDNTNSNNKINFSNDKVNNEIAFSTTMDSSNINISNDGTNDMCSDKKMIENNNSQKMTNLFSSKTGPEDVVMMDNEEFNYKKSNVRIMLSGFSLEEKDVLSQQVNQIGGKIILNHDFDFDYLVTTKPFINENFFVSLCTGRWILHPEFIEHSLREKKFLNPADYEWGTIERYSNNLEAKYVNSANACARWRLHVQNTGRFAFHDQNIIVISPKSRIFANIINCGGGRAQVVQMREKKIYEYNEIFKGLQMKLRDNPTTNITCIMIDYPNQLHCQIADLVRPVNKMNVMCVQHDYLRQFLLKYPSPSIDQFNIVNIKNTPTQSSRKRSLALNVSLHEKDSKLYRMN